MNDIKIQLKSAEKTSNVLKSIIGLVTLFIHSA